jgi:hypothetical protein
MRLYNVDHVCGDNGTEEDGEENPTHHNKTHYYEGKKETVHSLLLFFCVRNGPKTMSIDCRWIKIA